MAGTRAEQLKLIEFLTEDSDLTVGPTRNEPTVAENILQELGLRRDLPRPHPVYVYRRLVGGKSLLVGRG